jgi:GNAT superfamily N-acetyltransferase
VNVIGDIEDAFVAQWSQFGRWPNGALHERDGLLWFETPIKHMPYNGVIRCRLDGDGANADAALATMSERFRERGVECFWFLDPNATPSDLGDRLVAHGPRPVERVIGMSLELAGWNDASPPPQDVAIEEVVDDAGLDTYTALTLEYWEIPDEERELVRELHRYWGPARAPGYRYIALADGEPVGKAYLSLAGPPGVGAIYGMSVVPAARGRGVAGAMTTTIVRRAQEAGCIRMVLHSAEMAVAVYSRVGFEERCEIMVYGTAPLWSGEH